MHVPAGIATALFPIVVEKHQQQVDDRNILFQGIAIALVLSLGVAVIYFLLSQWFVELLFGDSYAEAGTIMKWYGFAMVPLALVIVTEHYLIAKSKMLFAYLFALALPVLAISVHLYHPTPFAILTIIAGISSVICLLGLIVLLSRSR